MAHRQVVFLCWSGTRGRKVAEALDTAIRRLECGLEPFRSPGIEKGSIWFDQVRQNLDAAKFLVVCLTPENARSPWIHYEAGAVAAKMVSGANAKAIPRVYPYLFQMDGVELTGPLAQVQGTNATKEDTLRLIRQLIPDAKQARWERGADAWWNALQEDLHEAEDRPLEEVLPDLQLLFPRKTFGESLADCPKQAWAARWNSVRDTEQRLKDKAKEVATQCRPCARELLQQLVDAVDGYATALESVVSPSAGVKPDGTRRMARRLLEDCEHRRTEVVNLLSGLADPRQAPVFEDSPRFQALTQFHEKKRLVHGFEGWLGRPADEKKADWRLLKASASVGARTSRWHFDRVAFYLCHERPAPTLDEAVDWLRVELERTRAEGDDVSHMPLTYCLAPLHSALDALGPNLVSRRVAEDARRLLDEVCDLGRRREELRNYPEPSRLRVEAERVLRLLSAKRRAVAPPSSSARPPRTRSALR